MINKFLFIKNTKTKQHIAFLIIILFISTFQYAHAHNHSLYVIDVETGKALNKINPTKTRPVASLTKIALALASISKINENCKSAPALKEEDWDYYKNTSTILKEGFVYSCEDLLHMIMIKSDNAAANLLARSVFGSRENAVVAMNQIAKDLNLKNTRFTDPSGIKDDNVSNAVEIAKLTLQASKNDKLRHISTQSEYLLENQDFLIRNTNPLIRANNVEALFSKTGFTNLAGKNLSLLAKNLQNGRMYMVVILGTPRGPYREKLALKTLQAPEMLIAQYNKKKSRHVKRKSSATRN